MAMMTDPMLRVHERTREELRGLKGEGETYSDVLLRVLPDESTEETILQDDGDMVVVPVSNEVHALAHSLAGDGVTVGKVVNFYLFKRKIEKTIPAEVLLDEVYHKRGGG